MITAYVTPSLVIATMRRMKAQQCSDSSMPRDVVHYIFENDLMYLDQWPSWNLYITARGVEYIKENSLEDGA